MTDPGEATGNYTQLMRERGWNWDELADDFARQAQQPALDGGANMRRMERWARSNATAGRLREVQLPAAPPQDPLPEQPRRKAVPRTPERRG